VCFSPDSVPALLLRNFLPLVPSQNKAIQGDLRGSVTLRSRRNTSSQSFGVEHLRAGLEMCSYVHLTPLTLPTYPLPLPLIINNQRIQIPLHTQQPQRIVRPLRLGQDKPTLPGLKLLNPPIDPPGPIPDRIREQRAQLGRAVVRRPAPQLGGLVPPGLAPVGDLPRRLPPREARDVAQPADQPMPLVDVAVLRGRESATGYVLQ
jgi:hypothetical protein